MDAERKCSPSIVSWIGKQVTNQSIPVRQIGHLISSLEGYPDGLLAIKTGENDHARIIVPKEYQKQLVMDTSSIRRFLGPLVAVHAREASPGGPFLNQGAHFHFLLANHKINNIVLPLT